MLHDYARKAPAMPGVYFFRDSRGNAIYIGKAKSLRNRLSSYFANDLLDRTAQMVANSEKIEFIVTDTEGEALLLESNLIKRYQPKYNLDLKDNERFTYILITDEKFPRMMVVRRSRGGRINAKGKVFGPFTSGSAYGLVAYTLRKIFKISSCRPGKGRPCLQYHLGFCMGVCAGLVSEEEYAKQVKKLEEVLSGGKKLERVIEEMEGEMKKAANAKQFERAMELRNAIHSLSSLLERQKMDSGSEANEDFIAIVSHEGKIYLQMFRQMGGVIRDRKKFEFPVPVGEDALSEFLPRFYEPGGIPRRIYIEYAPASKSALESFLSEIRHGPVSLVVPEKGDKKKLLELLHKNIMLEVSGTADPALVELQHELGLPAIPRVIECFDVSNLFGSNIVGAMVQFVNARPNKSGYRKFRIRSVEGQDDFASMKEMVFRRYYRTKKENSAPPDLILIDGGAGQLNAALSALTELGFNIPCISLAKEFEEIYHPDQPEPIRLARSSPALKVLQYARDEAHRFVISYHRLLRKKNSEIGQPL